MLCIVDLVRGLVRCKSKDSMPMIKSHVLLFTVFDRRASYSGDPKSTNDPKVGPAAAQATVSSTAMEKYNIVTTHAGAIVCPALQARSARADWFENP